VCKKRRRPQKEIPNNPLLGILRPNFRRGFSWPFFEGPRGEEAFKLNYEGAYPGTLGPKGEILAQEKLWETLERPQYKKATREPIWGSRANGVKCPF